MAMLWAQEIMSAETVEEAKALYERCPRLLKEKVKAILIKSGFEEITQKGGAYQCPEQFLTFPAGRAASTGTR